MRASSLWEGLEIGTIQCPVPEIDNQPAVESMSRGVTARLFVSANQLTGADGVSLYPPGVPFTSTLLKQLTRGAENA